VNYDCLSSCGHRHYRSAAFPPDHQGDHLFSVAHEREKRKQEYEKRMLEDPDFARCVRERELEGLPF
jgi:hypothetical protein